jgi:hypothetical protein
MKEKYRKWDRRSKKERGKTRKESQKQWNRIYKSTKNQAKYEEMREAEKNIWERKGNKLISTYSVDTLPTFQPSRNLIYAVTCIIRTLPIALIIQEQSCHSLNCCFASDFVIISDWTVRNMYCLLWLFFVWSVSVLTLSRALAICRHLTHSLRDGIPVGLMTFLACPTGGIRPSPLFPALRSLKCVWSCSAAVATFLKIIQY